MKISSGFTNTLRILLLFFFISGGVVTELHAQDFEEWKKQRLKEFQQFRNKMDKQFNEMLKGEWKDVDVDLTGETYDEPKPVKIPEAEKPDAPDGEPESTVSLDRPEQTEDDQPGMEKETESPADEEPESPADPAADEQPEEEAGRNASPEISAGEALQAPFEPEVEQAEVIANSLTFFGQPIQYRYYKAFETRVGGRVDKSTIQKFWKHLSTKDYPAFLDQLDHVRERLSLNDYGFARLIHDLGQQIYGSGSTEARLFLWFMLTQSEYDTRLGYVNNEVYLLVRTQPRLYNTTYFTLDGRKYYALGFDEAAPEVPSSIFTYEKSYPGSRQQPINLSVEQLPRFPDKWKKRTFSFSYGDTSYSFDIEVKRPAVDFYQYYPQAELAVFFNSRLHERTHKQLAGALKPLLDGKSNVKKVNLLLRFVQTAFDYQVDRKQFGREKSLFPVETLFYPASDCEDRSALFGYLVEHLTELEYIGLRYPNHLTPAVHFPSNPPDGSAVAHNGKRYYITDPTYSNADAGQVMPSVEGKSPTILEM